MSDLQFFNAYVYIKFTAVKKLTATVKRVLGLRDTVLKVLKRKQVWEREKSVK